MKISKLFANTLQSKTDLIFFAAIAAYNLLLGFYLKDFFVLSPMLLAFYLLSALPTLFFVIRIRSNAMRAIVEKVQAFYQWIIQIFEYDYECNPLIRYFDVRKTLRTKQGLCFDFAHLFAAFCRSQNIPCYAVDGISRKNSADRHTWNRVYFDGSWWNLDITADNSRTANGKELYGFHELECAFVPDEDFFITKIY